jgi:autotransporter translocation and assembly factor TamB
MGQGVAITPVSGLLQASGLPLPPGTSLQGGVAFVELQVSGELTAPAVRGSLTLNNTKMVNLDLEDRLSAITGLDALHIQPDLAIDMWSADIEGTPEKIVVKNLQVDLPEVGMITGSGVIDANRTLNFEMSASRHGIADRRPIPFLVRGACVAPIFRQPGKGS